MREEHIRIGGRELLIARPEDPEGLIDEQRFAEAEFLPYWAELWPSGLALADHVAGLEVAGIRVLELGCGLALPSFAAALAGADVLATDWAPEALQLVAENAARNGLALRTAVLDWNHPPLITADLVLAADVLYEERNALPLLALIDQVVARDGSALVADPGRRYADAFFALAAEAGWLLDGRPAVAIPGGRIARLTRVGSLGD
jgi:predicted nicotinamide N-methyase